MLLSLFFIILWSVFEKLKPTDFFCPYLAEFVLYLLIKTEYLFKYVLVFEIFLTFFIFVDSFLFYLLMGDLYFNALKG